MKVNKHVSICNLLKALSNMHFIFDRVWNHTIGNWAQIHGNNAIVLRDMIFFVSNIIDRYYAKRCFLGLALTLAKHMTTIRDSTTADILEFLDAADQHGKDIPTTTGVC